MTSRILIVDDDREVARVLRTALELEDSSFAVVAVPSAEEAILEVRRNDYDLLLLDVRLPGIDGLEMMRRIRKTKPEAQVIVMTGNPSPEVETEARRLKAAAFITKPVTTDEFLRQVREALKRQTDNAASQADLIRSAPSLSERLVSLRNDLGCLAVYLIDLDGHVVARAGDVVSFKIDSILAPLEASFSASLKICRALGGFVSQNLHFFDGDEFDVYLVNVGQSYMILMLFEGDRGAAQMGPVLRYGRQCADDMLNALAGLPTDQADPVASAAALAATPVMEPRPPQPPAEPAIAIEATALDAAAKDVMKQDVDAFWNDAVASTDGGDTRGNALSFEQALKLGLIPKDGD